MSKYTKEEFREKIQPNGRVVYTATVRTSEDWTEMDPEAKNEADSGDRFDICPTCHMHALKTVMMDDNTGDGIHEEQVCPHCGEE